MSELSKTCAASKVVHSSLILPGETNRHNTLFGGNLMSHIDRTASIAFVRHTAATGVTASMDSLNFIKPLPQDHVVSIEAMVSGVGSRSVEVFVKVTGEDLMAGEHYLAATAFLTFVVLPDKHGQMAQIPTIIPETAEEQYICQGYTKRRQERLAKRDEDQALLRLLDPA